MTTSPDDQQELEKEIEQTRERLGETVEALAAKADIKARAQRKLGQLTTRLKSKAAGATRQLRLHGKVNQAKQQAGQAGQQLSKNPVPVAATAGAISLVLFSAFLRRWMRRDK